VPTTTIPHRSVFRPTEVCEIADIQPYVLRSWEAEFPALGVAKGPDGPRMYRRGDVELVLKLKHLLFVEGLTLAGARRQLIEEGAANPEPDAEAITDEDVAALEDRQARRGLREVRDGLGWILSVLDGGAAPTVRRSRAEASRSRTGRRASARTSKPVRSKGKSVRLAKPRRQAGRKKR
jgi:DNA-binding transcriptional MerR regulator